MPQTGKERPNLVLIVADQLQRRALGCYGNRICRTPNIDGLAASGVVFDRFYANSALCGPCRRSLFTGRHPFDQPAWAGANAAVFPGDVFIADRFRREGYHTVSIGRLHGIPEDADFGFEDARLSSQNAPFPFNAYRQWFLERVETREDRDELKRMFVGHERPEGQWLPDELSQASWAAAEVEGFLSEASRRSPFFLHVGFYQPHPPWPTPPSEGEAYAPGTIPLPETLHPAGRHPIRENMPKRGAVRAPEGWCDTAWQDYIAGYYTAVSKVDRAVGRVIEALERHGAAENTIIAVTTDHGDLMGAFGMEGKVFFYEDAVRLPLILAGTGLPGGLRREGLMSQVDLGPTLLELAGLQAPPDIDGIGQSGVAIHDAAGRDAVHAFLDYYGVSHQMTCTGREKLYRACDRLAGREEYEYYDLENDPLEMRNLYPELEGDAEIRRRFKEFFRSRAGEVGFPSC